MTIQTLLWYRLLLDASFWMFLSPNLGLLWLLSFHAYKYPQDCLSHDMYSSNIYHQSFWNIEYGLYKRIDVLRLNFTHYFFSWYSSNLIQFRYIYLFHRPFLYRTEHLIWYPTLRGKFSFRRDLSIRKILRSRKLAQELPITWIYSLFHIEHIACLSLCFKYRTDYND